jgi:excisionase family DNA binding protein
MSSQLPSNRLLLSPREAAERLGISERCLWDRMSPRGSIPVVRIGRLTKIDQRDLVSFIDVQKQGGATNG